MKLLAFSDLHTDRRRARRMVECSRRADLVIGAGDFARFHLGLQRTIATLREIQAPVLLVPGNNESEMALRRACQRWPGATVLHGEAVAIAGTEFFGLGGGIPETPLPLSFDLSEQDAATKLARCPSGAVMIVHSPPWTRRRGRRAAPRQQGDPRRDRGPPAAARAVWSRPPGVGVRVADRRHAGGESRARGHVLRAVS